MLKIAPNKYVRASENTIQTAYLKLKLMKFTRLLSCIFIYILLVILIYTIIPSIVWIFGGNFLQILQDPFYATCGTIASLICSGIIMSEAFDEDYYPVE